MIHTAKQLKDKVKNMSGGNSEVLSYNLETLLAEKMQTILARGLANTRMRDFYDVYAIMNSKADQISFDVLKKAFAATCMKRETSFGEEKVRETLDKIKDDSGLEEMWNRFKRVNYFVDDLTWGEVSETIVEEIPIVLEDFSSKLVPVFYSLFITDPGNLVAKKRNFFNIIYYCFRYFSPRKIINKIVYTLKTIPHFFESRIIFNLV